MIDHCVNFARRRIPLQKKSISSWGVQMIVLRVFHRRRNAYRVHNIVSQNAKANL